MGFDRRWIAVVLVVTACAAPTSTAVLGVPIHPADEVCRNGRPDEIAAAYPRNDVYRDSALPLFPTATPGAVGLDRAILDRAIAEVGRAPRVTSLLVLRHGRLVVEEYFNGMSARMAANPHSATKSLLALLVGTAIEDGHLGGLDVPIGSVIPEVVGDSPVAQVSVGDLLAMSAGLEWDDATWPDRGATIVDAVVHAPSIAAPGEVWNYNSGLSNLLALALDRVVPGGLCRYAHERLLGPLDIEVDHWHENPEGGVSGGTGAFVTPRELARLGQLVLDGGEWQGRQLVSSDWIAAMVEPRQELPTPNLRRLGVIGSYGLHWWIFDVDGVRIWNASGYGGQDVRVIPSLDMVVVITHDTSDLVDRQVPGIELNQLFLFPAAGDQIDECPCPPDMYRAHPDGSGREALAPHPGNDLAGDWSPDGTRIAFHSFRDLNAELYVMDADGTDLRRLTRDWALDAAPKWSPDGRRLAFLSDRSADRLLDDPQIDVHVIDLETGAISRITDTGDVRGLDWSPEGNRIAFVRGDTFDGMGDLWAVDLATGETELVLSGPVGFPAWSPDGAAIAVDLPGGTASRVGIFHLEPGVLVDFGSGGSAAWSGDGAVLYATVDRSTLVAMDMVDGSRQVVGAMPYGSPSPDGEWILFGAEPG